MDPVKFINGMLGSSNVFIFSNKTTDMNKYTSVDDLISNINFLFFKKFKK